MVLISVKPTTAHQVQMLGTTTTTATTMLLVLGEDCVKLGTNLVGEDCVKLGTN
tara:strand:+ start:792 stop:953 length:162 start_codon:yes stop_codon:yes gene_type:complete